MEEMDLSLRTLLYSTLMDTPPSICGARLVSVIGSGGKTSLIESLAAEAVKRSKRVLITTTTKMAHPEFHRYETPDVIVLDSDILPETGRCILWGNSAGEKISSGKEEILKNALFDFDVILVEADGSHGLPLKMHREDEPVIAPFTTATVQVFGLSALNKPAESVIHRYDRFEGSERVADITTVMRCMDEPVKRGGGFLSFLNQSDTVDAQTLDLLADAVRTRSGSVIIGSLVQDTIHYVRMEESQI